MLPEKSAAPAPAGPASQRNLPLHRCPAAPVPAGPAFDTAWRLAMVGVCLLFAGLLWDVISGQAVLHFGDDGTDYFLPYYMAVADAARSFGLLTWDPWNSCGIPAFIDPQTGAFSPVMVLTALCTGSSAWGYTLYALMMWLLGGLGVLLLGRQLGAPVWGGLVGALGYLGCGAYLGHQMHTSHIVSFSFIPWVLWRLDAALVRRSWLAAVQAGALLGLSSLAGYPGLTMLTGVYCAVWALGRVIQGPDEVAGEGGADRPALSGRVGVAVGMLGLCAMVCAVVLAPVYAGLLYEGAGVTTRVGAVGREAAMVTHSLRPEAAVSIVSPHISMLLKANAERLFAGATPKPVMWFTAYCGMGILVLASFEMLVHWRSGMRWLILGTGVLLFLSALGPVTPVRGWLYDYFPPSRYIRIVATFRDYLFVSLMVLALLGSRTFANSTPRNWAVYARMLKWVALVWAVIALGGYAWAEHRYDFRGVNVVWGAAQMLLWPAMALLLIFLLAPGRPASRNTLAGLLLAAVAIVDLSLTIQVSKGVALADADPAAKAALVKLQELHQSALPLDNVAFSREPLFPAGNECVVSRHPSVGGYTPLKNPFVPRRYLSAQRMSQALALCRIAAGEQRVWFAQNPMFGAPNQEAYQSWVATLTDTGSAPMVIHTPEQMVNAGESEGAGDVAGGMAAGMARARADGAMVGGVPVDGAKADGVRADAGVASQIPVQLIGYGPTRMTLRLQSPAAGWVMVTDRWSRSWRAYVNGQPAKLWGADFAFRGVKVPAGDIQIDFRYEITWAWVMLAASWATLGVVLLATIKPLLMGGRKRT